MTPGYVVVANANAGSAEQERVQPALAALKEAGPVQLVPTSTPEDLDRALDGLLDRVLVVVGGDGSLHWVVQRLWDREQLGQVTLGLIPAGTGNDLARGLGLTLDPEPAARSVTAGQPRRLDLLIDDDGGVVVNAAHVGLGAEAARTAATLKPRLGLLAYPLGALVRGVTEQGWPLSVSVDGRAVDRTGDTTSLLQVGVLNGPCIGGGTRLCPPARPDDGLLDVVVSLATGPLARARYARALRAGRHLARADVTHQRGRHVHISGQAVRHNTDGELSGPVGARGYRVIPAAWSLLAKATQA